MVLHPVWYTSVYTSEIGFALHLPALINIHQTAPGQTAPGQTAPGQTAPGKLKFVNRYFQWIIAAIRIACNAIAAGLIASATSSAVAIAGWVFFSISVLLYIISYAHLKWSQRPQAGSLAQLPPIQPRLYLLAHLSILNFIFDFPGRHVPTVTISHTFLIIFNSLLIIFMLILATAVAPIREAWRCYRPEHFDSIQDYIYGTCPPADQTSPMCTGHPGISCPGPGEPSYAEAVWSTELHYSINFLLASLAVYFASLKPKLLYWQLQQATADTREQFYSALVATS
jgi:hypothetical protein